ncbi:MAG: hypothetical protein ACXIT4_07920 [Erythrobacter sp.]
MRPEGPERDEFEGDPPELVAAILAIRNAPPPFPVDDDWQSQPPMEPRPHINFKKLKAARRKVDSLNMVLREDAFDDWIRRYVILAEQPDEWTRARVLYENYLKRARKFGSNRRDRSLSQEVLATETQWGKMMGSLFSKARRRGGWYYPLRLKKGA